MKKIFLYCAVIIMAMMLATGVSAQISGTVFRDYNGNGVKNNAAAFNEPFVQGVTVKAFNSSNVQMGTTKTTDAVGAYSFTSGEIPSGTAVRIEFSGLALGDYNSANGAGNGTNIQFVSAPSAAINFAVNAPDEFWDNSGLPNPKLLAVVYAHGDINHTNSSNTTFGITQIDNNTTGHTPTKVSVATQAQVGALWGMGYQKTHDRFFFGSFLKRHVGFGPQGVGGVYMANLSGANYALSGSFTLQGVTPANSATALDMGTVNRVSTPNTSDFYLATGSDVVGKDMDAFGKTGKVGFGDVEVDDKNQQLVLVNLNQRRIVTVNIAGATASLNNASAATLGPLTRAYDILTLPGVPSCVSGQLRPFALKIYKGRGYLGAVCDASATPRDSTKLAGYILSFDPANISAGFTTELSLNFNYRTSTTNGNTNRWHSWADVWSDITVTGTYRYPEPLISDIEFDEAGGMNISITDRFGHQMGMNQTIPVAGSGTVIGEARISGDILHVCRVAGSWVVEGASGSCAVTNTKDNLDGYGDGQTVSAFEYFNDESGDAPNGEFTEGAMAKLMGTNKLVQTIVDPTSAPNTTGEPYWYSAGLHWFDVSSGSWSNWTALYDGSDAGAPAGTFMKGNGLGDIEFMTSYQPIQVGNRIWQDNNGNGIQDAGETILPVPAGTTVTLRSPGINGLYGDADDQTWTTTTNASGNYYFSALSSADNRKPAAWTGVGNTILQGFDYRIEIAVPSGFQITKTNVAVNSYDNIDNDASLNGSNAVVVFNTSNTNHNFDIGFKVLATIGDKVWRDDNSDGVQQAAEPGLGGITVTLKNNLGAVAGTTVTDAYGNYLFDNLTGGAYTVTVTLPANYTFSTQTNTTDDNNTTGTSTTGSDVNVTTGQSYTVTLSAGENNRNIDAGLIFTNPAASNSLGDRIWYDNNSNGTQDAGEPGVAGTTVTLYASNGTTVIATTVTDANGNYLFTNLPASTDCIVGVTVPAGMVFTTTAGTTPGNATTNSDVNATLGNAAYGKTTLVNTGVAGTQTLGIDAGIIPQAAGTASLGDKVWNDLNSNGTQDAGEPGIAGVTVNLYEDVNGDGVLTGGELAVVRTMVTDAFGNYIFNNLVVTVSNKWQVEFVQPLGYNNTPVVNNNSGNDETDSDISNNTTDRTDFIRLKADERNTKTDAGFVQSAPAGVLKLGDKVWRDDNADGQQGVTEPGVPGVTVKLYQNGTDGLPGTADDVLLEAKSTDVNGSYLFTNLAATAGASSNYNVQFSNIPAGFSITKLNAGAAATDNNANSLGKTGSVNLIADDLTIDAGIAQGVPSGLASLGDRVWYDLNNDGIQNAGELGAAGVTVNLYKDANNDAVISLGELTAIATTTTNALGEYMFGGLSSGSYQVGFTLPATLSAYTLSIKDAGSDDALDSDGNPKNTSVAGNTAGAQTSYTALVVLAEGEDKLTVDLGIVPPALTNTLGGTAWFDTDTDGLQTSNPGRVAGVMVTLFNNLGTAIATTTTDDNGDYLFVGLADGDYSVAFTNYPAGFDITVTSAANDATGSDPDKVNGKTTAVTLNSLNRNDRSLDAGLISSSRTALGNKVWEDLNGDGIQDAGEPGIPGVTVTVYDDLTNQVATLVTDNDGYYFFPNLNAGLYQVGFSTLPAGMEFTTKDNTAGPDGDGANTWTGGGDSDVNPGGGFANKTDVLTLTAAVVNLTVDAGLRRIQVATVGNRVWDDLNGNGLQNAGEPGIPGVVATLYNNLNQKIGSSVTDGNGIWLITNVPTGNGYYVIFTNKPVGAYTVQDNGGAGTGGGTDTDTDSDVNSAGQSGTFNVTPNTINVKIDAGIMSSITLPIKLISFTARPQDNNVLLQWEVGEEINTSRYEVEFSADVNSFVSIGSVTANNNRNYSLLHTAPVKEKSYYRLKITDKNGNVSYSAVCFVNFSKVADIMVYPNPTADRVNITFTAAMINKPVVMSLLSVDGRLIMTQKTAAAGQTETIYVSRIAAGKYILQIAAGNELINKTIEVIR